MLKSLTRWVQTEQTSSLTKGGTPQFEQLEQRLLLSATPVLPGLQLADSDASNWQGQVNIPDERITIHGLHMP